MTPENIRHNVRAEWALSDSAWTAGETLCKGGLHRESIAKYDYSSFHAACAALLTGGLEVKTHSGVRSEFSRLFIATGRIARSAGRSLGELQKEREDADYNRDLQFTQADADEASVSAGDLRDAAATLRTFLARHGEGGCSLPSSGSDGSTMPERRMRSGRRSG